MSLSKNVIVDQIEITESGHVQVRTATRVVEDGVVLSSHLSRKVIVPGDDYSNEDARVQTICKVTHTADVIAAYKAAAAAQGV